MNLESGVLQIHIEDIIPNRFQPRLNFDEQGLKELSDSIKEHGIIQPLVLRKLGNKYEIIAGERRYKAAQIAGLTTVPAVIANIDDNQSAEVALVENVQRRDLTAIEEARSYKSLLDKGYLTQEQLAKRMGLSQPSIANKLRLLNLDEEVQQALLEEKISERHARTLLTLEDKDAQKEWLHKIINERMTVRQLDIELKKLKDSQFQEEEEDIPLVASEPSIEDIRANSMDIREANKIDSPEEVTPAEPMEPVEEPRFEDTFSFRNVTNFQDDNFQKATSIPEFNVTTPDNGMTPENPFMSTTNTSGNRFFNLNQNDSDDESESGISPMNREMEIFDSPNEREEDMFIDESKNLEPMEQTPPNPMEEFTPASPFEQQVPLNTSFDRNPNNKFFTPVLEQSNDVYIENQNDKIFDPMSTLDNYNNDNSSNNFVPEGTLDLKGAIAKIRECIEGLGNNGFYIEVEEIDFESIYQITMNIHKND